MKRSHSNSNRSSAIARSTVARQLRGMGAEIFRVGVFSDVLRQEYKAIKSDGVLSLLSFLRQCNANGANIYVRPETPGGLILLDDISGDTFHRLEIDGLSPACVVETSPNTFQAWVRLAPAQQPIAPEITAAASRILARRYYGDMASTGRFHYGRLAGFSNRKPARVAAYGLFFARCRIYSGAIAPKGPELLGEAKKELDARVKPPLRKSHTRQTCNLNRDVPGQFLAEFQSAYLRSQGDASRADYRAAQKLLRQGCSMDTVKQAIISESPAITKRKAGHVEDYARRTVEAAARSL